MPPNWLCWMGGRLDLGAAELEVVDSDNVTLPACSRLWAEVVVMGFIHC
jgi:hypothetical protein